MSLVNLEQAAKLTGRSRRTIYNWVQKDGLKMFARRNLSMLIDKEELLAHAEFMREKYLANSRRFGVKVTVRERTS